ncbi:Ribosomal_protein L38e [Hexamita inflata]|uniref:Ribosomal protein L38e n=1 Tax=Hexamita inflata TaxID=28002 RepID=A0AA86RS18_9EUKA|nr:Ribosomal protein L38e [Hexamita inflata]CAI9935279.1 Ribosomal protein L38e [Hexamita inflata]CAI9971555.1 Ribosomal protein L38e [Hexamita inflata]
MPASINQEQFEKIVATQTVAELRVKRIERGNNQGHMKLKLRTPRRLYTLYLKDPGVAKTLVKAAQTKNIQIVKFKHGKRV